MGTERLEYARKLLDECRKTSEVSGCGYVMVIWKSVLSSELEYRRAYFDDFCEANIYKHRLLETMNKFGFNFHIYSNIGSCGNVDGGLEYVKE